MDKYLKNQALQWLKQSPQTWKCEHLYEEGVNAIFYSGIENTKVFAWIGLPKNASKENPVPGIVLVHGGGATAISRWVKFWNSRGYAAISMDTCGGMPHPDGTNAVPASLWPRHSFSGASGWGAFDQATQPPKKQWFSHAISAIIFANTLLRNMPEVDENNIGIAGVSWGSVLSLISAGVDPRYKAVNAVYGNGYLGEESIWKEKIDNLGKNAASWWINQWDPANFLQNIKVPVLWFASTNDVHFLPRPWQKSTDTVSGYSDRCMKLRWFHSHGVYSEEQPEINAFFDEYLAKGPQRLKITQTYINNNNICAKYTMGPPINAFLNVVITKEENIDWPTQEWYTLSATFTPCATNSNSGVATASLPLNWKAAFLTIITDDLQYTTTSILFNR